MRRFWTLTLLSVVTSPIALFAQDWTLEADIELANKYEWRGLQLDPGFNTQYAVYGSLAWDDLILTTGVWSLTDLSSEVEGLTGYLLGDPGPGRELRRGNTWEVYAGARGAMPGAPFRSAGHLRRVPGSRPLSVGTEVKC